jgi:hypothetical protein
VYIPAADADHVREAGQPAGQAKGVTYLKMDDEFATFAVESGVYKFSSSSVPPVNPAVNRP